MNRELIVVYLELAAAKAKALAEDTKRGKHYPGDLSRGISEVQEALSKASSEARDDR